MSCVLAALVLCPGPGVDVIVLVHACYIVAAVSFKGHNGLQGDTAASICMQYRVPFSFKSSGVTSASTRFGLDWLLASTLGFAALGSAALCSCHSLGRGSSCSPFGTSVFQNTACAAPWQIRSRDLHPSAAAQAKYKLGQS